MQKKIFLTFILSIFLLNFSSLLAEDENTNSTFAQRREEAQERAENYNSSIYAGDQRASEDEIAAAIKNFNPEIETEYIEGHRNLESSFVLLNSIEKKWNFSSFERKFGSEWNEWMKTGLVGAFSE